MMMGWCIHCQNTGWLDCYCEGDMCGCENGGEYPCPHCDKNDLFQDDLDGMTIDEIDSALSPAHPHASEKTGGGQ